MTIRTLVLTPTADPRVSANRKGLAIALSVATLLAACGDRRSPSEPAPAAPSAPAVTYTLSGIVSEDGPAGVTPLEGAIVLVTNSGQHATTGSDGSYSLSGVAALPIFVRVSKPGYVDTSRTLTLSGDTRMDLQVVRIVTYTLSGIVYEATEGGRMPIEGVSVYCDSCGSPEGHTFASSDENGFYSFAWTSNGSTALWVRKDGYRLAGPTDEWITAAVSGDTRFDIAMIRR